MAKTRLKMEMELKKIDHKDNKIIKERKMFWLKII